MSRRYSNLKTLVKVSEYVDNLNSKQLFVVPCIFGSIESSVCLFSCQQPGLSLSPSKAKGKLIKSIDSKPRKISAIPRQSSNNCTKRIFIMVASRQNAMRAEVPMLLSGEGLCVWVRTGPKEREICI